MRPIAFAVLPTAMVVLSACTGGDLTRSKAQAILNEIGKRPITKITLSADQAQRVEELAPITKQTLPDGREVTTRMSEDLENAQLCLPDSSDARVMLGQYALCTGAVPPEVTWEHPGVVVPLKKPIGWRIVEVTGIYEAPDSQKERIVEYTWQYDLSPLRNEVQEALRYPPRPGKSLLRLYDDGWRFVEFK